MRQGEKGMALLAVLGMVFLLSALAVLGLQTIRTGAENARQANALGEATLLERSGAEAALQLAALWKERLKTGHLQPPPARELAFGDNHVTVRLAESGACFNLNSLARRPGEETAPAVPPARFAKLLETLGIPDLEAGEIARATANALTGGLLLADGAEWRTVPGVTADHWTKAAAFLCALPTREASSFNVNRLRPEQAPLLVAFGLQPDEARRAIASQPQNGYRDMEDFWDSVSPHGVPPGAGVLALGSRWVRAEMVAEGPRVRLTRALLVDMAKNPPAAAHIERIQTEVFP